MSARRPRFSIRRWMMLVAVVAVLFGVGRWVKAWARLHSAQVNFQHYQSLYDEGRATGDRLILWSRRLMQAQVDWNRDQKARIQAIEAHLRRLDTIIKRVRKDLEDCMCRGCSAYIAELAEAEQYREEDEAFLAREKRGGSESIPPFAGQPRSGLH